MTTINSTGRPHHRTKLFALTTSLCAASALFIPKPVYADDNKIRHVLVISIDGMHSLDMALWVKNNPNSALAKLSAQGMNLHQRQHHQALGFDSIHGRHLHGSIARSWRHVL